MYKIKVDNQTIFNNSEELSLQEPVLDYEANAVGTFSFTIYPNNPYYNKFVKTNDPTRFKRMKSIVKVYRENVLIFRGRILEIEDNFYFGKQVICEGELAFLIDSVIKPYSIKGSPEDLLKHFIDTHNSQMANYPEKQFKVGRVTVTDGEENDENREARSSESTAIVWNEITNLIDSLGGYLLVDDYTDENGTTWRQINWLTEAEFLVGTQAVNFGENLVDLKINVKGDAIATALIPEGAKLSEETNERLSIAKEDDTDTPVLVAEPDGDKIYRLRDLLYSEKGIEEYGLITATRVWDDITEDTEHLLQEGIKSLAESSKAVEMVEITAVDLFKIINVAPFRVGTRIKVTSRPHGLDNAEFPLTKISLNLLDPASNTLTLTKAERTFTETSVEFNKSGVGNIAERIEKVEKNASGLEIQIVEVNQQLTSKINQTSEEIYTKVSEDFTLKEDHNKLIESVNTEFQQTSESFEMRFNEINSNLDEVENLANEHYQEQLKYIRFIDGNIVLGEEGNEITLRISNDRISFLQNGIEVAYFSNNKLYVIDGEFINSLKLGKFAFIPRSTGNLSFKKVT